MTAEEISAPYIIPNTFLPGGAPVRIPTSAQWPHSSKDRIYICIDLKSFYASVECSDRGLDPLTTNLLVADGTRSDKTICLAVSPSLKAMGVPGRPRLFEAKQAIREAERRTGQKIEYITATPRMSLYIQYSADIYEIYLRYVAPEDIHVYSVDEVFIDITDYMSLYRMKPREIAAMMIRDVLRTTGITATAGIGTNMYLAKVAMDIVAKHMPADQDGVRIAELTPESYRLLLWRHTPLTDFWQIGPGTSRTLAGKGIHTMGDIAVLSLSDEDFFYTLFGINAELIIDHAWGLEPCRMQHIKTYRPKGHSTNNGQVLPRAYSYEETTLAIKEMADVLSLDLVDSHRLTNCICLYIGYDADNENSGYTGPYRLDHYGRRIPEHTGGRVTLGSYTSSTMQLTSAFLRIFEQTANPRLKVRRIFLTATNLKDERSQPVQMDLFTDWERLEQERRLQIALLSIKKRYGRNAVLRGMNLLKAGRTMERNAQIGGHKA